MAAASAAAAKNTPEMINGAAGGVDAADDTFAPSVWGDYFITYDPSIEQRSEEWMTERAEELKRQVRRTFEDGEAMAMADAVTLVDTLERLGVDNHFREEIAVVLSRIHADQEREFVSSDDLHVVATRFRLLRQHGLWVSTDVFNKFRDGSGNFSASVTRDPRVLLSLYNAAHMAVPGEADLDGAIAFTRRHLGAMKGELWSPMAEQVSRALDIPLPRFTGQLEAMHYIAEYEHEETHDGTLLELARLSFNLMRSLHLKELKALSLWWRDVYDAGKLTYARDRAVETYFWCCGMVPGEEYSRARIIYAKAFALVSLLDDTFDVQATLQECHSFDKAIQRWDESAVSLVPEYLRMLYMRTLSNFKEFEDLLEPHEKYRVSYAKRAYQMQSDYYLQEAIWSNDKYQPSFEEHQRLSVMSAALPMLNLAALMGYGAAATREVFEWTISVPDVVHAGAQIGRLLNDISSYKLGKTKNDVASAVECYMMEKGLTGEEAVAAISAVIEDRWRVINWASMEVDRSLLPVVQLVASIARSTEVMYLGGRDGYTFGADVKDLVARLFLDPVPL